MNKDRVAALADAVWEETVAPFVQSEVTRAVSELKTSLRNDPGFTNMDAMATILTDLCLLSMRASFKATEDLLVRIIGETSPERKTGA